MGKFDRYNQLVNKITTDQKTYHLWDGSWEEYDENKTLCNEDVKIEPDDEQLIHIESEEWVNFIEHCLGSTYLYLGKFDEIIDVKLLTLEAYDYDSYLMLLLASLQASKKIDICGSCVRKLYKYNIRKKILKR